MKILWSKSPLMSSDIIEALKDETSWSPKTIHTLISRLVKKSVIGADKIDAFYHYYPLLSEAECVKEETKTFIEKVYNGSLGMLLSNFIKEEKFTEEEIAELQSILEQKKE